MSILNISPCRGLHKKRGQIIGDIHTEEAINISADSTGTAFPTFRGGDAAEYYMLQTDGAMYIRIAEDATIAGGVAIGDTMLQANQTLFISRDQARGFIGKLDKA